MAGLDLTVGQLLGSISGIGMVVIAVWTQLGKSKDTSYTRLEGERNRLSDELKGVKDEQRAQADRLNKVEAELEELRLDHKTLLGFLRDIVSGRFDGDWIKGRAADLLGRFGGGGTP